MINIIAQYYFDYLEAILLSNCFELFKENINVL